VTSNYCAECVTNWSPHHCDENGTCPECHVGTKRQQEPISDDAERRYQVVKVARASADLHDRFETYYAAREEKTRAA
jgi:hypothetical protein